MATPLNIRSFLSKGALSALGERTKAALRRGRAGNERELLRVPADPSALRAFAFASGRYRKFAPVVDGVHIEWLGRDDKPVFDVRVDRADGVESAFLSFDVTRSPGFFRACFAFDGRALAIDDLVHVRWFARAQASDAAAAGSPLLALAMTSDETFKSKVAIGGVSATFPLDGRWMECHLALPVTATAAKGFVHLVFEVPDGGRLDVAGVRASRGVRGAPSAEPSRGAASASHGIVALEAAGDPDEALAEGRGLWVKRLADAETAAAGARAEAEFLRQALAEAHRKADATADLRDRLAALAPLLHAASADLKLIEAGTADIPAAAGDAPSSPSSSASSSSSVVRAAVRVGPSTADEEFLSRSSLFDGGWYARSWMGGEDGDVSPARHYLERGAAAGAWPHPLFDAAWHRRRNMGAGASREPAFLHFLRRGAKRGDAPCALFDPVWYARRHGLSGVADGMAHFQAHALERALDPHPLFDSRWYLEAYPEVRRAGVIPVHHYMTTGAAQGCWPSAVFDPGHYAKANAAALAGALAGATTPLAHFIEVGSDDGLNPNSHFSTAWYRATNKDVARDHWIPLAHYMHVGGAAGRDPSLEFDTAAYLKAHPDLDLARETALGHFLRARGGGKAAKAAAAARAPKAALARPPAGDVAAPLVNWVIGPKSNIEWAYGNNATRFAQRLPGWRHEISGTAPADVVLYFDAIVAERFPSPGKRRILRVGGARPLDRLYGDDPEKLRDGLAGFDAVITLSPALQRRVSARHPNAVFIPNGLDLDRWAPEARARAAGRPFTAGIASSAVSSAERDVKGIDIAVAAAEAAGVPLLRTHKGAGQIRHDRMIEDFYANIDVLLHPVAPGREGSSNVIMEALALGVPVITTLDSGFHGERLQDGVDALIRPRDATRVAEALQALRDEPGLAARIGAEARAFALRNHDIAAIAAAYEEVFRQALTHGGDARTREVAFLPFWKPTPKFASSRLRGDFPAALLQAEPTPIAVTDALDQADVAVVVQSAEQPLFDQLAAAPGTFLVYDVCDRYFENAKLFKTPTGEVDSLARFNELMERANVVIAPTTELKGELAARFPLKPVYCVPEMIDYSRGFRDAAPVEPKRILWFGSPHRGNFDSARWVIDACARQFGYEPRLVTRRGYFSQMPDYLPFVVDWSMDTFLDELAAASLCVVSHSEEEKTKSPNRFVTAVAHGVPTIVSGSRPSAALLREAGCGYAVVADERELAEAVRRLQDPAERRSYLSRVQAVIEAHHGDRAVREAYLHLLLDRVYDTRPAEPRRVAFVTHNLNFGEGAPKSLFEVVLGLRDEAGVQPFVYCAARGELEALYEKAGVPLKTFSDERRPPMRVLNNNFDAVRRDFKAFLEDNRIDHVVANTIKSATFATFAHEMNIPASIIIRESFDKERRFDYYLPAPRAAAERALLTARNVIFVSGNTSSFWADQPMTPDRRLIKNGVSAAPFAEALAMDRAGARAELGLADAEIVAICVGTINERKGQIELLNWFVALPDELRARLTILFVGATENRGLTAFRAIHDTLAPDLQARLRIVATTPDIGLYYRASDLFLMNSSQESYPRSVMEALLFGLPVVSTPVFGVLEQVVDGETGFIFPYNDQAVWTDAINRLATDPETRNAMAAAAAGAFWKLTTHAEMIHDYRCIITPPQD